MGNIRKLQVKLGQTVEDKINQRLGYREYEVIPPSGVPLQPRPRVDQMDMNRITDTMAAYLLQNAPEARMPNALYKVMLSRNFSYDEFTQGGTWLIKRDDWSEPTQTYIAHHRETDSRIELTLGVLKV